MSLINQMLQDLDARRSEAGGPGPFGEQVRAVPPQRSVHPAWWVAAALGVMLAGVLSWIVLREPVPDPYTVQASLPLKFAVGLELPAQPLPEASPRAVAPQASLVASAASDPVKEGAAAAENGTLRAVASPAAQAMRPPESKAPAAAPESRANATVEPGATQVAAASARSEAGHKAGGVDTPATPDGTASELPVLKQVREWTPQQRAENEYRKAALALQQQRRQEALSGFEQALQLDPRHAGARQAAIGVLLELKRAEEAATLARDGLALEPRRSGFAMILARLQMEKNDVRGALETLDRTRPHAADQPDYLAFRAALLQRSEQHKAAADEYTLALQKMPQNGLWWMGLGISLQAEKRLAEAREAFLRARASNALSPELLAFVDARLGELK